MRIIAKNCKLIHCRAEHSRIKIFHYRRPGEAERLTIPSVEILDLMDNFVANIPSVLKQYKFLIRSNNLKKNQKNLKTFKKIIFTFAILKARVEIKNSPIFYLHNINITICEGKIDLKKFRISQFRNKRKQLNGVGEPAASRSEVNNRHHLQATQFLAGLRLEVASVIYFNKNDNIHNNLFHDIIQIYFRLKRKIFNLSPNIRISNRQKQ